jgi:hypothetical protein
MKIKLMVLGVFALAIGAICVSTCFATMQDANNVKEVHEGSAVGCTVCHPEGNFKELNSYGQAYNDAGRSVDAIKAIDAADSDGDGVANSDEIKAGTNPGDDTSK